MKEDLPKLDEKWFIWEGVDDEGNYVKLKYRKIEEYSFYLRFLGEWFTPCETCQRRIKKLLLESDDLILGNRSYKPPVEFRRRLVTDDDSYETLEERPATPEDRRRLGKYGKKRAVEG